MLTMRRIAREALLAIAPGLRHRLDSLRAEVAGLQAEVARLAAVEADGIALSARSAREAARHALLNAALDTWLPTHPLQGPRVTYRGLRMAVHRGVDLYVSACIRDYGIWEPVETDCLLDGLGEGDHFIDIGANIGYYAVIAGDLVGPAGRVFAFEPDPVNFDLLRLNLALNGLVQAEAIRAAVSDSPGEARLHRNPENLGDHRLNPIGDAAAGDSVAVATRVLDTAMLAPPGRRTMVKIDTQGWEARIILGNLDFMARADQILFEWSPRYIDQSGCDPVGLVRSVAGLGFDLRMVDIEGRRLVPFGVAEAEAMLPALRQGSGAAEDPMFQDLVATRR